MESAKFNCLVIDDEPIARKIIMNYIEQMPLLVLASEQINALNAIEYLRTHSTTDIILLDINMPNLTGFQLLKIIQPRQPVIFTTAYAEYAVESYEVNAVDYLLKPFSFERFTKAVYKAISSIENDNKKMAGTEAKKSRTIFIKSNGKNYPVFLDDILYCEAMKNYTIIKLKHEQKLTPLIPLSKCEALLSEAGGEFIQIHRSFLVAKKHIAAIGRNHVTIEKFDIPIGVQFKGRFLKEIGITNDENGPLT